MSCYTDEIFGPQVTNKTIEQQTFDYFTFLIGASIAVQILTLYIDWRQLLKYSETSIHPYLKSLIKNEEFKQSQVYNSEKHKFGMFHEVFETILSIVMLYYYYYTHLWNFLDSLMFKLAACQTTPFK